MRQIASALAIVPLLTVAAAANDLFEAPEEVTNGGDRFVNLLYPTPVLHDIDGDGSRELIVGDLMGHLYTCKSETIGTSWNKSQQIESEGKTLRLNNW